MASDLYQFLSSKTDGIWLEKKSQSNMGRGIKLISDVKKYRQDLLDRNHEAFGSIKEDDSTDILVKKLEEEGKLIMAGAGDDVV